MATPNVPTQKERPRCPEIQVNSIRAVDFTCKNDSGSHNVHIDPVTGLRWGHRGHRHKSKGKH